MNSILKTPAQPNFRTLDLNLLRVFDEVMAERSLTKAAHNLALTQPAVSNAMRRLRETLGDDLVRRSGQGLNPHPVRMCCGHLCVKRCASCKPRSAPVVLNPQLPRLPLC
jgi:Bacterial regulatory helix-turn-helix protein, lysR family